MSGIFSPRRSILPESRRRLWPKLRPATGRGFVLYGDTAIVPRLGIANPSISTFSRQGRLTARR
ncbi:hypothetical protein RLIN73S_04870 [Rhodanobacter lindaniclasticus]